MTIRIVICDANAVRSSRIAALLAADGMRVRCMTTVPPDATQRSFCDVLLVSDSLLTPEKLRESRAGADADAQVLVITTVAMSADGVRYIEAGAQDLLVPPYVPSEVVGKLRHATVRSAYVFAAEPVQCAQLRIDLERKELRRRGRVISMTANEFRLIDALVRRAGCLTTTGMLRQALWGEEEGGTLKALAAYVRAIRVKLEQDPDHPKVLSTEPGVGYRWMPVQPLAEMP